MDARVQVYSDKMQKAYEFLEADFAAIRAGRANPHVLDKLRVDYYGTPTPIQQVGNVTVPEARIIQIAPWEKSLIKEIEKAIMTSDLGINPTNDGQPFQRRQCDPPGIPGAYRGTQKRSGKRSKEEG